MRGGVEYRQRPRVAAYRKAYSQDRVQHRLQLACVASVISPSMRSEDWRVAKLLRKAETTETSPLIAQDQYTPSFPEEKFVSVVNEKYRDEGEDIEEAAPPQTVPTSVHLKAFILRLALLAESIMVLCVVLPLTFRAFGNLVHEFHPHNTDVCPQAPALSPVKYSALLDSLEDVFAGTGFQKKAFESLGGAVRIPTEMYDDLKPPGQDPRWDIFADFHAYLAQRFPLVHTSLKKTIVNEYALVYHWQGADDSLKPALLTAHQDVVPVEPQTIDTWKNPPFSGLYDGEWIWGRGSCDDKSGLISSLIAVETLLENNFEPERTFVFAFGIDEERGGVSGATAIRDYLLSAYGKDAFAILVDEGGKQEVGEHTIIAAPAVAEKGSFNLRMEVAAPGGHSSVPPAHTSIGILAALITALEANPHQAHLYRTDTFYAELQCQAAHDPSFPKDLRKLVAKSVRSDKALRKLAKELERTIPQFKAIAGTTQAVDVVRGGVKTNALPESAYVIVNHRIAGYSSVGVLQQHIIDTLAPVAKQYNVSVDAFGARIGAAHASAGHLTLSDAFGTALEPAPVTPSAGSVPYDLLSGTIRNVLTTSPRGLYENKTVVVAPTISLGNTDTKHYWDLTKHIFRYSHKSRGDAYNGAHTVNEAIRAEGFTEMIRFFTTLILNVDEAATL